MSETTTDARVAAIEMRANAATPGPWYAHNTDDAYFMNVYCITTTRREPDTESGHGDRGIIVAGTLIQSEVQVAHDAGRWEEDAAFIARAREDVPWLIAQLRARDAEIERLRAVVGKLPLTADGVPVVPGMTLWLCGPNVSKTFSSDPGVFGRCDGVYANSIRFNGVLYPHGTTFYSTRESALAAAQQEGK